MFCEIFFLRNVKEQPTGSDQQGCLNVTWSRSLSIEIQTQKGESSDTLIQEKRTTDNQGKPRAGTSLLQGRSHEFIIQYQMVLPEDIDTQVTLYKLICCIYMLIVTTIKDKLNEGYMEELGKWKGNGGMI